MLMIQTNQEWEQREKSNWNLVVGPNCENYLKKGWLQNYVRSVPWENKPLDPLDDTQPNLMKWRDELTENLLM